MTFFTQIVFALCALCITYPLAAAPMTPTQIQVQSLLAALEAQPDQHMQARLTWLMQQLGDRPYLYKKAIGEGKEIEPYLLYRMDGFNCQTLVQVVLALLQAKTTLDFELKLKHIAYGAEDGSIKISYANRNHFIDADFNPINEQHGWIKDVTSQGKLAAYAKISYAHLERSAWFLKQHVHVNAKALNNTRFQAEEIATSYLPKELLVIPQINGSYQANLKLFALIPTPAIAEIVYNPKLWRIKGKFVKDLTGTELTIGHLGFVYWQSFRQNALIYQHITCKDSLDQKKI
jgi:hypothetical protein